MATHCRTHGPPPPGGGHACSKHRCPVGCLARSTSFASRFSASTQRWPWSSTGAARLPHFCILATPTCSPYPCVLCRSLDRSLGKITMTMQTTANRISATRPLRDAEEDARLASRLNVPLLCAFSLASFLVLFFLACSRRQFRRHAPYALGVNLLADQHRRQSRIIARYQGGASPCASAPPALPPVL